MTNGICYIFGAGEFTSCSIKKREQDLVIAADGGYSYALQSNLDVDVLLGDFDSLSATDLPDDRIVYPSEKDDTDMMLALRLGLEKGYLDFHIYGGLGGRTDHTLANIQALTFLNEHHANGILFHESYAITTRKNSSFSLPAKDSGYVSVFCLSDVANHVTIRGLKYTLQDGTLHRTFPIGVSNEFVGAPAEVCVEDGTIAILWYFS